MSLKEEFVIKDLLKDSLTAVSSMIKASKDALKVSSSLKRDSKITSNFSMIFVSDSDSKSIAVKLSFTVVLI